MTYEIRNGVLHIPDPEAFGLEGDGLYNQPDFILVDTGIVRTRRSYTIHQVVIQHGPTGRFFRREFSLHEMEGWEWDPGCGRGGPITLTEVWPHEVITVKYKPVRP